MLRRMVFGIILLASNRAWANQDVVLPRVSFQATAIQTAGRYQNKETIYYAGGKLRIERGRGFSTTILDMNTETQYILMTNHTYLVLPMDDELFRRYFPLDPHLTGAPKLGTDRIDGVGTTRYPFGNEDGLKAEGTFWLNGDGIMVKRDYDDGLFGSRVHHHDVVQNISIGPQASSLFVIPAGFRKTR